MREVVFVDAARTPFCPMGGTLKSQTGSELGVQAVRALLNKTGIEQRGKVDSVIGGCGTTDRWTIGYMRYLSLGVRLPLETSASFVEMQDGSAIASINHAAGKIALGFDDVVVVGGNDSWSTMPVYMLPPGILDDMSPPSPIQYKFSPVAEEAIDHYAISDLIANRWNISRAECDEHTIWSKEKYKRACETKHLNDVASYVIPATGNTPEMVVDMDEVRPDSDISTMAPVHAGGITTEGNSAYYADGAAFLLMMSLEMANELGYQPIAKWVAGADIGCEPSLTGAAAAYSNLKALKQAGLSVADIDVWENNEITAAYDLCVMKEMMHATGAKISREKWNRLGGALAYGHANAATGARMAISAMRSLAEAGKYAVISSSCGGGQGVTAIIQKYDS